MDHPVKVMKIDGYEAELLCKMGEFKNGMHWTYRKY